MNRDYWHKQTLKQPLFPSLIWSRPESRVQSGKLLIIGGSLHSFALTAGAYNEAVKAGIGMVRVLIPDVIKNVLGKTAKATPGIEFVPSTISGSFSQKALDEFLSLSHWADGVLLASELGHNSETAILLEKFIEKYTGLLTISSDTVDYFTQVSPSILERSNTCLILNLAQLQKLAAQSRLTLPITSSMDLLRLVDALHELSSKSLANIIFQYDEQILVASGGKVSATKSVGKDKLEQGVAVHAAVWWLQTPSQPFEAITSSIVGQSHSFA